jgi:CheY-like chemotaxis protein
LKPHVKRRVSPAPAPPGVQETRTTTPPHRGRHPVRIPALPRNPLNNHDIPQRTNFGTQLALTKPQAKRPDRPDPKVAPMSEHSQVLIVDDDDVVRRSYQRSLQAAHYNVEAVCDGADALAALEQKRFDVVLLDLRMPGMDGMSVLRAIKQAWPKSEVVVITGYPTVETAKQAVQLGAFDYLAKPVGPAEVISAASGALTQQKFTLRREFDPDAATEPHTEARRLAS